MAEDSHKLGGQRSQARHNVENLGAGGILFVILGRIDGLTSMEQTAIMGAGMVVMSAFAKMWSENGMTARVISKLGLGLLTLFVVSGCAINLGRVTPELFEGQNGETIIACTTEGVQIALGDGGVCRNIEGGHVSETFADLFTGTIEAAGRVIGGVFTGLGSAGAAITPE